MNRGPNLALRVDMSRVEPHDPAEIAHCGIVPADAAKEHRPVKESARTVRIAGHDAHHRRVVAEKYL